jgi:hypothetical protein
VFDIHTHIQERDVKRRRGGREEEEAVDEEYITEMKEKYHDDHERIKKVNISFMIPHPPFIHTHTPPQNTACR